MPTARTSEPSPLRVAAVTGQLVGALYGLRGIPDRWLERLAWKDRLIDAGELGCRDPFAEKVPGRVPEVKPG